MRHTYFTTWEKLSKISKLEKVKNSILIKIEKFVKNKFFGYKLIFV